VDNCAAGTFYEACGVQITLESNGGCERVWNTRSESSPAIRQWVGAQRLNLMGQVLVLASYDNVVISSVSE